MPTPTLPVELSNGTYTRTASTPTEYWNLRGAGWSEDQVEESLTPQQKAARTRAAKKAADDQVEDGGSGNPDDDIRNQAGDANSNE